LAYGYTQNGGNNGQITGITDNVDSGRSAAYSFDANNRITSGSGVTYDAAGNVTNDGTHAYTFDAENRITQVDAGTTAVYVYNASGERVRKTTSSGSVDYLYDLSEHSITELSSSGGWNRGEVYAGGKHLATYNGGTSGTTYFVHADWLGTERARTTNTGSPYESCVSLPFGDGQSCTGGDPSPLHFTGKQRDTESALDYFGARYYSSSTARWLSPDWSLTPAPVPYANTSNPQSLNLYGMVRNNSESAVDADGHVGVEEVAITMTEITAGMATSGIAIGGFAYGLIWTYADLNYSEANLQMEAAKASNDVALRRGATAPPTPTEQSERGRGNKRETQFEGVSGDEVKRRARDKSLSPADREKARREEKARELRRSRETKDKEKKRQQPSPPPPPPPPPPKPDPPKTEPPPPSSQPPSKP